MARVAGQKQELAEAAITQFVAFQRALGDKRRYPRDQFRRFFDAVRAYADATRDDELIHRELASNINGLSEYLRMERKHVPSEVLFDADRLETIVFCGYDPSFEGDEPPGL